MRTDLKKHARAFCLAVFGLRRKQRFRMDGDTVTNAPCVDIDLFIRIKIIVFKTIWIRVDVALGPNYVKELYSSIQEHVAQKACQYQRRKFHEISW